MRVGEVFKYRKKEYTITKIQKVRNHTWVLLWIVKGMRCALKTRSSAGFSGGASP